MCIGDMCVCMNPWIILYPRNHRLCMLKRKWIKPEKYFENIFSILWISLVLVFMLFGKTNTWQPSKRWWTVFFCTPFPAREQTRDHCYIRSSHRRGCVLEAGTAMYLGAGVGLGGAVVVDGWSRLPNQGQIRSNFEQGILIKRAGIYRPRVKIYSLECCFNF